MQKKPDSSNKRGETNEGEREQRQSGLERRDFLKLSASGVLVSAVTGCAFPVELDAVPGAGDARADDPPPAPGEPPSPPEVDDDLLNPAAVLSESWQEPWTWRPEEWPDDRLVLNVIRNENPGNSPSPGNFGGMLFSYGGISPAPTVRVRNDGAWKLTIRNTLGLNQGLVDIGPAANPFDIPDDMKLEVCRLVSEQLGIGNPDEPDTCLPIFLFPEQVREVTGNETRPNWDIGGHVNGLHATHTTNLHTHGLHVQPQTNPDGTHSDNVHLRIIPKADFEKRAASRGNSDVLRDHEHVGELDYDIRVSWERNGEKMVHPPGTHWYHPHSHGSTANQVSSGMAGFLIIEGDVDEAINRTMTGEPRPDPRQKTGKWDYRERLIFVQRVFLISLDPDAGAKRQNLRFPPFPATNGVAKPTLIKMRPGAVERWRVINGSVDGAGTKRFMVVEGQYTVGSNFAQNYRVITEESAAGEDEKPRRRLEPITGHDIEKAKQDIHQLSVDGITLVAEENGRAVHRIRDLSRRNKGMSNPLLAESLPGETQPKTQLRGIEDCFRDGDSLRRAFVRPNEVLMSNANRTDLLFKAPMDGAGKVYTIFAMESLLHSDTHQANFQTMAVDEEPNIRRPNMDMVVAWIHVDGPPVEGGDFDIQTLNEHLPPVPPLLMPVGEEELRAPASEAAVTGVPAGSVRTRTIAYSGTGATDMPIIEVPDEFAEQHPELERRLWYEIDGVRQLLGPDKATMGINPEFDLKMIDKPAPPLKFMAHDPRRSRMLIDTAEEWVVYNNSSTSWSHTDLERYPQPGSYDGLHFVAYPILRAEGQRRHALDPEFRISMKGNDHPFHIHINPMWVLRIDVPDENGEYHNILPEPCWMDTAAIPRNGGRIVFRSRFEDFTGTWIHHCHILNHEDNGMMQNIECVADPAEANYRPRKQAASFAMSGKQVDEIYPPPSPELRFKQNLTFIDPSPIGGYEFPGFDFDVPVLDDD